MKAPRKQPRRAAPEADRLEAALEERDAALTQLAAARATVDALRLRLLSLGEEAPPNYPGAVTPGDPPLRYKLADELHGAVKGLVDASPVKGMLGKLRGRKGPRRA